VVVFVAVDVVAMTARRALTAVDRFALGVAAVLVASREAVVVVAAARVRRAMPDAVVVIRRHDVGVDRRAVRTERDARNHHHTNDKTQEFLHVNSPIENRDAPNNELTPSHYKHVRFH